MSAFKVAIERLEQKYLITETQVDAVRRAVMPYCAPDKYNGPDGSYNITSLYLDTPTLALHRATMRNDADRFKLRVRTYSADGDAFLEVKRKVKSVVQKRRVAIAREEVKEAAQGALATASVFDSRQLEEFSSRCISSGAEPVVFVSYEREAYESTVDAYARVTFDRRLRYQMVEDWDLRWDDAAWQALDGYWQHDGVQSPIVLELKCGTRVPWWILEVVRTLKLRRVGFSKYSKSILAGQRQGRGKLVHSYG